MSGNQAFHTNAIACSWVYAVYEMMVAEGGYKRRHSMATPRCVRKRPRLRGCIRFTPLNATVLRDDVQELILVSLIAIYT